MTPGPDWDRWLIEQYEEQTNGFKPKVFDVSRILALDGDNFDVVDLESNVSQMIFDICLNICRLLSSALPIMQKDKIKLPKIEVSTFDGNTMNWRSFCEQYTVSIYSKPQLSNPEKLAYMYLQQALKNGPARHVTEGLLGKGDSYADAIDCLHHHYGKA